MIRSLGEGLRWLHDRSQSTASRRTERGAVAVLVALSMTVLMISTALSFDIGRLIDSRRSMQAVADSVALDTANALNGGYAGAVDPASSTGQTLGDYATSQASASALRNNFNPAGLTIALGTWTYSAGFTALPGGNSNGNVVPNAVRIGATSTTTFDFGPGTGQALKYATAVRTFGSTPNPSCLTACPPNTLLSNAIAGFTIGSYVAGLSTQQTVLGSLLGQTLGSSLSTQVIGYQGLAYANVSLADLLTASAGALTVNNLTTATVTPPTLLSYYATALGNDATALLAQNQSAAAGLLQTAEATINSLTPFITATTPIHLCKFVSFNGATPCAADPSATQAASANLNALGFLRLTGEVANGTNALKLDAGIGNLITTSGYLVSPIAAAGPGPVITTKTTDQQGNITLSDNTSAVSIGLAVTAGTATGTLETINCGPTPETTTTTIRVDTQAVQIAPTISVVDPLLGTVSVPAATTGAGSVSNDILTFTGPFNAQSPSQTSGTSNPTLTVSPTGSVSAAVTSVLNPVLNPLNSVLTPVLQALGVSLGGATVTDNSATCGLPVLVG